MQKAPVRAVNVTCGTAPEHTKPGCTRICRLKSHAKHTDERRNLEDLRSATKVIARTLANLLAPTA